MKTTCVFLVNSQDSAAIKLAEKMRKSKMKHGTILMLTKAELDVYNSDDFQILKFDEFGNKR